MNHYGMRIENNEVIDAREVGGLARFANHSCSPNCKVERWQVNGEICCGIFAKEQISAGEEITIDYGGGNAGFQVGTIPFGTVANRARRITRVIVVLAKKAVPLWFK